MALETEAAKVTLKAAPRRPTGRAGYQSGQRRGDPGGGYVDAASTAAAAVELDEAETRQLIDEQLRQAGWLADSTTLRYALGTRPEKGKNLAIAEWPTMSGPADYVLFVGLTPVATVEAKRKNVDVSAALQQAKRYSRSFNVLGGGEAPGGPWGKFRLPFAFSTNGRPYLRQLETRSGIWFCDLRRPDNLSRALDGWYTPAGLIGAAQAGRGAGPRATRRRRRSASTLPCAPISRMRSGPSKRRLHAGSGSCWSPWPPAPARPRSASR